MRPSDFQQTAPVPLTAVRGEGEAGFAKRSDAEFARGAQHFARVFTHARPAYFQHTTPFPLHPLAKGVRGRGGFAKRERGKQSEL